MLGNLVNKESTSSRPLQERCPPVSAGERDTEKERFKSLRIDNLKAGRAWSIKETFSEFWTYSYKASAENFNVDTGGRRTQDSSR